MGMRFNPKHLQWSGAATEVPIHKMQSDVLRLVTYLRSIEQSQTINIPHFNDLFQEAQMLLDEVTFWSDKSHATHVQAFLGGDNEGNYTCEIIPIWDK